MLYLDAIFDTSWDMTWRNGTNMIYMNWYGGKPAYRNGGIVQFSVGSGIWRTDYTFHYRKRVVCEFPKGKTIISNSL